jgi:hypothetical protein
MNSPDLSSRINKILSDSTCNRAEDFCIIAGISLQDFLASGIESALRVFDTFIESLPPKYSEPVVFKRMLLKNPELVYSMIEAAGSTIVSRNVELADEVKSASNMLDHHRELHLRDLSDISLEMNLRTERFSLYEAGDPDDADDDFPTWQVTVFCGSKKITHRVSHYEMSVFFNHAVTVSENPDPDYEGLDGETSPLDDIDNRFDDTVPESDDWGDDPV